MQTADKNAKKLEKRAGKLVDLVCTSRFFLYKRGQVSKKGCVRLLVLFFDFTCYCLDTKQAWSNATKRGQTKLTFADAGSDQSHKASMVKICLSAYSSWQSTIPTYL